MNNLLFSLAQVGGDIVAGLTAFLGVDGYRILINGIGVIAIGTKILETQNKKRNRIIFYAMLGAICWVTYFILYGDFTSALVNLIGFIQLSVFFQRGKHKWADSKVWLVFFLMVQVAISVFTWQDYFSLFPVVGGLLSTIAYFVMDEKAYRYLFLSLILCWIGNGIARVYVIALIHDCFAAVSILVAIIRYNILGKDKSSKQMEEVKEQKEIA